MGGPGGNQSLRRATQPCGPAHQPAATAAGGAPARQPPGLTSKTSGPRWVQNPHSRWSLTASKGPKPWRQGDPCHGWRKAGAGTGRMGEHRSSVLSPVSAAVVQERARCPCPCGAVQGRDGEEQRALPGAGGARLCHGAAGLAAGLRFQAQGGKVSHRVSFTSQLRAAMQPGSLCEEQQPAPVCPGWAALRGGGMVVISIRDLWLDIVLFRFLFC